MLKMPINLVLNPVANPRDEKNFFFMNEFIGVILIDECICHSPQNYKEQSIVMNMKYKHLEFIIFNSKATAFFLELLSSQTSQACLINFFGGCGEHISMNSQIVKVIYSKKVTKNSQA